MAKDIDEFIKTFPKKERMKEIVLPILGGMFFGMIIVNVILLVMKNGAPTGFNAFFPFNYFDIGLFLLWIVASALCSISFFITMKR